MDLLQSVTMADLSEDQFDLAELIGIENYRKLVKVYGGNAIRIMQEATLIRKKRDSEIRSAYSNGAKLIDLTRQYRLSDKTVRTIINQKPKQKRGRKNVV